MTSLEGEGIPGHREKPEVWELCQGTSTPEYCMARPTRTHHAHTHTMGFYVVMAGPQDNINIQVQCSQ